MVVNCNKTADESLLQIITRYIRENRKKKKICVNESWLTVITTDSVMQMHSSIIHLFDIYVFVFIFQDIGD